MHVWFLLCVCLTIAQAQKLITFGIGRSSNRLYLNETEIFNYTLTAGSTFGVMTHFWVTGDPGEFFSCSILYNSN
jgi:hypothetical protein